MRKFFQLCVVTLLIVACKNDNTREVKVSSPQVIEKESKVSPNNNLLDYREIKNRSFAEDYMVEGFGIQKKNDSLYRFVFKLNNETLAETVLNYSIGVKLYYNSPNSPIRTSHSPELKIEDNSKYIYLSKKLKGIDYVDSMEVYSYARNNWKASGRIKSFKVRDILLN